MSTIEFIEVSRLSLDLKNYRATPQTSEEDAVRAMISISPNRFYAIIESIIEDGYIPNEIIILLDNGSQLIVKEGNRRIASLKFIHGILDASSFGIPRNLITKIDGLTTEWKNENLTVPCTVYDLSEKSKVDKIVNLTHGKGDKASREDWTSVARARHNRDANGSPELGLDLLEKYFIDGSNITLIQAERWAGDYPLTVLTEALSKVYSRLNFSSLSDLVRAYPNPLYKNILEEMMLDIGLKQLDFNKIRSKQEDFAIAYGIAPIPVPTPTSTATTSTTTTPSGPSTGTSSSTGRSSSPTTTGGTSSGSSSSSGTASTTAPTTSSTSASSGGGATPVTPSTTSRRPIAYAINDPKHVRKILKLFIPRGINRQKVVTLRDELKVLDIGKTPIAFCFLLRSMFEISAKAYCTDHSISLTKPNGDEKKLVALLTEISRHIVSQSPNQRAKQQELHGATVEINKTEGILSVTSMNQLVHNPTFSITAQDICTLFSVIYPLLHEMNS